MIEDLNGPNLYFAPPDHSVPGKKRQNRSLPVVNHKGMGLDTWVNVFIVKYLLEILLIII